MSDRGGAAVDRAFGATPRASFLPADVRHRAAFDGPLPIGRGQTGSQPRTVADMLRLLDVPHGARVLDVGSGSGWTTALLAHLTGPTGVVDGVELEPDLVRLGRDHLAAADRPWATIRPVEPGVLGRPDQPPYDRVLVSAEARELPMALVDQLAPGGRMVVPVHGRMLLVVRPEAIGEPLVSEHGRYRFVPLR